jgi:hypothetical protein
MGKQLTGTTVRAKVMTYRVADKRATHQQVDEQLLAGILPASDALDALVNLVLDLPVDQHVASEEFVCAILLD